MSTFTPEEKEQDLLKRYIKEHLFEWSLETVLTIIYTILVLNLCEAKKVWIGVLLAIVYSVGKIVYNVAHFSK